MHYVGSPVQVRGDAPMKYESRWERIRRQNEERRRQEILKLKNQISNAKTEAALFKNLCFDQRKILQEILAICAQEQMEYLDMSNKLERIEQYARRALVAKR